MNAPIEIQFDRPTPIYRAGEAVSGNVVLHPGEPLHLKKVEISILWHTLGKGTEDHNLVSLITALEEQTLSTTQSVPFHAELPAIPLSYEGHHINIHWIVRVNVSARHRARMSEEARFQVVAPGQPL